MRTTSLLLCAFLALVLAAEGKTCSTNTECGDGECCQVLSKHMIMSRRDGAGKCRPYIKEGQQCDIFGKDNGFCSCQPGYTCATLEVPINAVEISLQKRILAKPRPGYRYDIKCVKDRV